MTIFDRKLQKTVKNENRPFLAIFLPKVKNEVRSFGTVSFCCRIG